MVPAAVTVVALLASETTGGVSVALPIGIVWPLILTLTMVDAPNAPAPLKPTSQAWPVVMGWYCSQGGCVAVRFPDPSGPEMLPFHAAPAIEALPMLTTTSNEVMGLANASSVIRTAPEKPPDHAPLDTTSTVTPPPETATAAVPALASAVAASRPPQATTASPSTTVAREAATRAAFPLKLLVEAMRSPPWGTTGDDALGHAARRGDVRA